MFQEPIRENDRNTGEGGAEKEGDGGTPAQSTDDGGTPAASSGEAKSETVPVDTPKVASTEGVRPVP